MSTLPQRRPLTQTICLCVMLVATSASMASAQVQQRNPFKFADLVRMISDGLSSQLILSTVQSDCMDFFRITPEMEGQLVAAGADPSLMQGLRGICRILPEGLIQDPVGRWILVSEPGEWSATNPQTLAVNAGDPFRVRGLAHAPTGIAQITVNGQVATLASDPSGATRFEATVDPSDAARGVEIVLQPAEGVESLRRTLPMTVAPTAPTRPERVQPPASTEPPVTQPVVRQRYNPTSVAMSGLLVPGLAQFRTGKSGLGVAVLGGSVAAFAAGLLSSETTVRCAANADPCPAQYVLNEESSKPLLVPGVLAGIGIAAVGAVMGYSAAKRANEAVLIGGQENDEAPIPGLSLVHLIPTVGSDGGLRFHLARIRF